MSETSSIDSDRFVSVGSAARYADRAERTIFRWIERGLINRYRDPISGDTRVSLDEIDTAREPVPAD